MNFMKFVIRTVCAIGAIVFMSGCANSFDKKATSIDWTKGSVIVASIEVDNQIKPGFQPTLLGIHFKKVAGSDTRANIAAFSMQPISGTKVFLLTQQIQPGSYSVSSISGMSQHVFIKGYVDFTVDAPFSVAPNSVIYLGRISGVNQEKADKDDQSTGGIVPLLDQAISGYGSGTLKVSLSDNYAEDVKVLKQEYASMQNVEVIRSPLKTMTLERASGSKAAPIVINSQPAEKSVAKEVGISLPNGQVLQKRVESK